LKKPVENKGSVLQDQINKIENMTKLKIHEAIKYLEKMVWLKNINERQRF